MFSGCLKNLSYRLSTECVVWWTKMVLAPPGGRTALQGCCCPDRRCGASDDRICRMRCAHHRCRNIRFPAATARIVCGELSRWALLADRLLLTMRCLVAAYFHEKGSLVDKQGFMMSSVHRMGSLVDKVECEVWFVHGKGDLVDKVE